MANKLRSGIVAVALISTAAIAISYFAMRGSNAYSPVQDKSAVEWTVFSTQTPTAINLVDGPTYELGMLFKSDVPGYITAIRFYKGNLEPKGHVGNIWSENGDLLVGGIVFCDEIASGWQTQRLSTPLAVAANTTYVISVGTGSSNIYAATTSGLVSPIVNGPVVGNNGVFGPLGAFPTSSYFTSNYFRDVVFTEKL